MTDTNTNRVLIFDTTMRDGEQSPGASMNLEEKLRLAEVLEEMGVDVIEAGFPIASPGDFEAVNAVAKVVKILKDLRLWIVVIVLILELNKLPLQDLV